MSSSMDYAGGPITEDIDEPDAALKTDCPDVRYRFGIAIYEASIVDSLVPRPHLVQRIR